MCSPGLGRESESESVTESVTESESESESVTESVAESVAESGVADREVTDQLCGFCCSSWAALALCVRKQ